MAGGSGGAWGPTQFGMPSTPSSNPSSYAAFNNSPLMNMATANTNSNIGNQERAAGSSANAAGAGGSAGANAQMRDIAAQGENANAGAQEQAAANAFGQQLQEEQMAQNQYKTGAGLELGEQANRQAALSQLPGGQYINLFGGQY
jgi:hypothetical protein